MYRVFRVYIIGFGVNRDDIIQGIDLYLLRGFRGFG